MIFLARYWRVIAIAAAVGLVLVLYRHQIDSAYERGYEAATADMAAQVARANFQQAARDAQARKTFQANESRWIGEKSGYQNQITELLARKPVVRVCRPATGSGQLSGAPPAARSAGGASQQGVDHLPDGLDAGPGLVQLAGECESYRRRLIELKERWPE